MKGVLINVGANTQKYPANVGRSGPIFGDGTFRYVPIPEKEAFAYPGCPTYDSMDLAEFVPFKVREKHVHHDPEFKTMTFGDYPWGQESRISDAKANLRTLSRGDWLFFLASLDKYSEPSRGGWSGNEKGFYLIGYFELEQVLPPNIRDLDKAQRVRFANNAHLKYSEPDTKCALFAGSSNSHLLSRAFPFTRNVAERVLRAPGEPPLQWKPKVNGRPQTETERINSYTRNPRILDDGQVRFLRDSLQPYI